MPNKLKPSRFVVLGNSALTLICLEEILRRRFPLVAVVSTPSGSRQLNSIDLRKFCRSRGIAYREWKDLNAVGGNRLLRSFQPDYIVSTWPYLLSEKTLRLPRKMVIGSHPTALPLNRGRHPLHWLLGLGIPESKMSFFQMDAGVDHGPILMQTPFKVHLSRPIQKTVEAMNRAARQGFRQLLRLIQAGRLRGKRQSHARANLWRKRTIHDVLLDPRLGHEMALRTVHSFAPPYPGAVLMVGGESFRVHSARVLPSPAGFARMEFGRIARIEGRKIRARMGNRLLEMVLNRAIPRPLLRLRHLHPPSYYLRPDFAG